MKKGAKIALGVVGVLVVGGVAAAAWQWNNLNALRYGLICRQYGKQKQVIHKTTLYLLKLSTNIRLFVCWGRHPK